MASIIGNVRVYTQAMMSGAVKNIADALKSSVENIGLAGKNIVQGEFGKA